MDRTVFKGYNYPSESQLPQPKLPEAPPPPPLNNSIFIDQQRQPPAPLQARNNENQFEKLNPQQGVVPQYHLPPPQLGSYSQNIYYIPLNEIEPKQGNYYYPPNNSQCHHIEMSPSFHYTNTSYVLLFDLILSVVNVVMFLTIILPCYLVTLPDKLKAIPQIQRIKCQTCKTILTEQSINLFNEPPYFCMCIKIIGIIIFFLIWQKTGELFFMIFYRFLENTILIITDVLSSILSSSG